MFKFHKIKISDFRSYRGTHEFEFPSTSGLYYLTGENKVTPAMGANAAGKSTFLDAITWALFGYTSRGLKAGEILSWGSTKSASVALEMTVGDVKTTITRTQKPNSLLLGSKHVDQAELEKFLRLNLKSFMYSILSPQFGKPFFSISPTEKLALFSDIKNLNYWLDLSKRADEVTFTKGRRVTELQRNIELASEKIEIIEADIVQLQESAANFDARQAAKFRKLEATYVDLQKATLADAKLIRKLEARLPELNSEVSGYEITKSALEKSRDRALEKISTTNAECRAIESDIEKGETFLSSLDKVTHGQLCPLCYNAVDKKTAIAAHRASIKEGEDEIEKLKKAMILWTRDIVSFKMKISQNDIGLHEAKQEYSHTRDRLVKKQAQIDSTSKELDRLTKELDEVEQSVNPHQDMLDSKRAKLTEMKKGLSSYRDELVTAEAEFEASKFWIKGFKRVRLFIIEQAFETLEIEVNNCLAQLGLTDWQITFDIERENKSGGITKGFVVFIKSPQNAEPVKWENWSGGETQRLQLAGDLGLANLIMQEAGLSSSIEFYDEPSNHLSTEGMMDLANMLHERAINEDKTIWIVDHTSVTNFGDFESVIIARKTGNGSSISIER